MKLRGSIVSAALLTTFVAGTAVAHPTLERLALNGAGNPGVGALTANFPSKNVTLLSHISLEEFGQPVGNDCWGYTSPSGREYAIMGMFASTAFVEITDPENPVVLGQIPGPGSSWRDIKVIDDHAYIVSEGGGGIQVIDLSRIDEGEVPQVNQIFNGDTTATHNIAVNEETGFIYRTGGGSGQIGLQIYATGKPDALGRPTPGSPANPALVRIFNDVYVHDAQAVVWRRPGPYEGREIVFACSGFGNGAIDTSLRIYDVTDKNDIVQIADIPYPSRAYSHQGWLSEDQTRFYLNDELDEGETVSTTTMRIFDVADLENASFLRLDTNGVTAIDHNLYVRGDKIFAANYRSGLRVFDISDQDNPEEVAYFDTFPADDSVGFDGAWSNFPYFESGTVIISDINSGLFVVRVDIPTVDIAPSEAPEFLSAAGGTLLSASFTPDDGEELIATRLMVRDESGAVASFSGVDAGDGVFEFETGPLGCGSVASYWFEADTAAGDRVLEPAGAPSEVFSLPVATSQEFIFTNTGASVAGFETATTAIEGAWERGVPLGNGRGDPDADFDGDGFAWLTENDPADSNSDVDSGSVTLTSPVIDASGGGVLSWAYWYHDVPNGAAGVEDSLEVQVATDAEGTNWQTIRTYRDAQAGWREDELIVGQGQAIGETETLRVRFIATDETPGGVVEAGLDGLEFSRLCCEEGCDNPADADRDGEVTLLDFSAWLSLFAAGEAVADQNFDGEVTLLDFSTFLANFALGCP